jgi:hypothetical protein
MYTIYNIYRQVIVSDYRLLGASGFNNKIPKNKVVDGKT